MHAKDSMFSLPPQTNAVHLRLDQVEDHDEDAWARRWRLLVGGLPSGWADVLKPAGPVVGVDGALLR